MHVHCYLFDSGLSVSNKDYTNNNNNSRDPDDISRLAAMTTHLLE